MKNIIVILKNFLMFKQKNTLTNGESLNKRTAVACRSPMKKRRKDNEKTIYK